MSDPRPPKCSKCGSRSNVQWANRPGAIPGADHAGRWICGDCLFREGNPDTAGTLAPFRKPKHPQEETLFT